MQGRNCQPGKGSSFQPSCREGRSGTEVWKAVCGLWGLLPSEPGVAMPTGHGVATHRKPALGQREPTVGQQV